MLETSATPCAGLGAALEDALPTPDVQFATRGPTVDTRKGMLSYLHRIKDGRNIYFFANSTDVAVDTEVILRGDLKLQSWNPHTGATLAVERDPVQENNQPFTRVRLQLGPVKSVFLIDLPETQGIGDLRTPWVGGLGWLTKCLDRETDNGT